MTFVDHCFSVVPCLLDVSVPEIESATGKTGNWRQFMDHFP